jgi:uncharacterized protein YjbI with pentapeptide repeats
LKFNLKISPNKETKKKISLPRLQFLFFIGIAFGCGGYLGWKNFPGYLKANLTILKSSEFLPALIEKNELKTLFLNINFKNFQKIQEKRQGAIEAGNLISSKEDFVGASIRVEGASMPCKVRLKGDLSDHWDGSKWSFRVIMKNDQKILGMSRFSLQDPVTRLNTNEWLFLETLRSEGLLAVRYHFVNVVVNGKTMGIYAMEEHFSKEFIESSQRRTGIVVAFDDYLNWRRLPNGNGRNINKKTIYRTQPPNLRDSRQVEKNSDLTSQVTTAFNLIRKLQSGELSGESLFSPKKLGKFFAICQLWGAEHNFGINNINFLHDPIIAQLEPIGYDAWTNTSTDSPYCYFTMGDSEYSWVNHALSSPEIAYHYIQNLSKFTNEDYLRKLRGNLFEQELQFRRLLIKDLLGQEYSKIWRNYSNLLKFDPWQRLKERAKMISSELSEPQPILAYANISSQNDFLKLTVRNALSQPVEIIRFEAGNKVWEAKDTLIFPSSEEAAYFPSNDSLILPIQKFEDKKIQGNFHFSLFDDNKTSHDALYVVARIFGLNSAPHQIKVTVDSTDFDVNDLPFANRKRSPLSRFPFVTKESDILFSIKKGYWHVNEDLYVPPFCTLKIAAGTTLAFSDLSTLVARGNLLAEGTPLLPILFTTSNESWPGILLHETSKPSSFKNCIFEMISGVGEGPNPNGLPSGGWVMTGGVNLYNANSLFDNCTFNRCETEDALNIFGSRFEIIDCNFSNTYSDAFDGDFVSGEMKGCNFYNIGGDGADFSGSQVSISNSSFSKISDKAISVGEKSVLEAQSIVAEDVSFGVVSKDQSVVRLNNSIIRNAKISAVSAYQKKPEFGPAEIYLEDATFEDCSKSYLIQSGSTGSQDNKILPNEIFFSESLYQN